MKRRKLNGSGHYTVHLYVSLTVLWEQLGVWRVPWSEWRRCSQINSCLWEKHTERNRSLLTYKKALLLGFFSYITEAISNISSTDLVNTKHKEMQDMFPILGDYSQFREVTQIEKHFRGKAANPVVGQIPIWTKRQREKCFCSYGEFCWYYCAERVGTRANWKTICLFSWLLEQRS